MATSPSRTSPALGWPGRTWAALARLLLHELRGPDALASRFHVGYADRDVAKRGAEVVAGLHRVHQVHLGDVGDRAEAGPGDALDADADVRAVVLTGAGGVFVAGTDISQFTKFKDGEDGIKYEKDGDKRSGRIARVKKPVIAQIHGWCVGGGSDFALGADLVIASEDARIGTPYSRMWGAYLSGMWIYRLGLARAKWHALTGTPLTGRVHLAFQARDRAMVEAFPEQKYMMPFAQASGTSVTAGQNPMVSVLYGAVPGTATQGSTAWSITAGPGLTGTASGALGAGRARTRHSGCRRLPDRASLRTQPSFRMTVTEYASSALLVVDVQRRVAVRVPLLSFRAFGREEAERFRDWQASLDVVPTIAALRRNRFMPPPRRRCCQLQRRPARRPRQNASSTITSRYAVASRARPRTTRRRRSPAWHPRTR